MELKTLIHWFNRWFIPTIMIKLNQFIFAIKTWDNQTIRYSTPYRCFNRPYYQQHCLKSTTLSKNSSTSFSTFTILEKNNAFWRNFLFNTMILMILSIFTSAKILFIKKAVMLHIVTLSEKLLVHFGLHWRLTLNGRHNDLPKFIFITGKNW